MAVPSHAVTVMSPKVDTYHDESLRALFKAVSADVIDERIVSVPRAFEEKRAVKTYLLSNVSDAAQLRVRLESVADTLSVDCVLQSVSVRLENYRLAVFDMDSTLIQCEVIDRLAELAGVGEAVAAITERAMRGELDFQGSFRERLGMLRGLDESALSEVAANLPITDGMPELILTLRARGVRTAILSGGFDYFARHLQQHYGFDEIHANRLDIAGGKATGEVVGDIVDGQRKKYLLEKIAAELSIEHSQVIAVGDGANDLPMLATAGLGIAFEAKPIVRAQVEHNIRHIGLDGVLYLLGSSRESNAF